MAILSLFLLIFVILTAVSLAILTLPQFYYIFMCLLEEQKANLTTLIIINSAPKLLLNKEFLWYVFTDIRTYACAMYLLHTTNCFIIMIIKLLFSHCGSIPLHVLSLKQTRITKGLELLII